MPLYGDQKFRFDATTEAVLVKDANGLEATNGTGDLVPLATTPEGHLEVAVHGPRLPFGSIHTESLSPIFQGDAIYGLNTQIVRVTTGRAIAGAGTGTATGTNNLFKCSTGTTSYSFGTIQSRKRLRYRAGQGVVGRFTALFSSPVASSILIAGYGTAESGYYFGYNGTSFGILHVTSGVREIQTLTISTASTATNDYEVTLNGVTTNVTATNNGSTVKTAYEIAQGTYAGWTASQVGSTVVFLSNDAGNKASTFSLAQTGAGTPAAGSFAETLAGVSSSDTWIPQSSWNGDKLDGTGASGVTLDPSKGNVFQIGIQYLGFGSVSFEVEVTESGNNATFATAHIIEFPNTITSTSVSQPSFPFTMTAYSAGSTTDISVSCASFAGFIEGEIKYIGPRLSYIRETNGFVGSTASTYYPMFTLRNALVYNGRANQSVIYVLSISCSHDDATPVSFYLIRNATLVGTPNFATYSTNSCALYDNSATTCTISTNEQTQFVYCLGQNAGGAFVLGQEIEVQPGETLTLAARAVTGTATYVIASLNTREDQ